VLVALIGVLPLWIAQPFVAGCARIVFRVAKKRVGYMLVNLRLAFPDWGEEERRSLARESWVHFAWNALDVARCNRWDAAQLEAHVSVEGVEHLENALAAGCGVIALTLHMGNFELASRRAPLHGLTV
jgi:lauroyl/myristoyl acyltransferase